MQTTISTPSRRFPMRCLSPHDGCLRIYRSPITEAPLKPVLRSTGSVLPVTFLRLKVRQSLPTNIIGPTFWSWSDSVADPAAFGESSIAHPPGFEVASDRKKAAYRDVLKHLLDILLSAPAVKQVTLNFKKATWAALGDVFPHSCFPLEASPMEKGEINL